MAPEGGTSEPLPTEYTVDVTCTPPTGDPIEDTITFGAGGGIGTTSDGSRVVKDIPEDSTCTVVEEGTDQLPDGATVTYVPSKAPKSGVTMGNTKGTAVVVTNDFSGVTPATGDFRITKEVAPPGYTGPPDTFTISYACQGPETGTVRLSPGETATVSDIRNDAYCIVREPTRRLPAGWEVSYTVDGKTSSRAPVFKVTDTDDVSVTVTNTAPDGPPDKDA
nr:DUF5979 domain-containing protein [Streptomyces coryli]